MTWQPTPLDSVDLTPEIMQAAADGRIQFEGDDLYYTVPDDDQFWACCNDEVADLVSAGLLRITVGAVVVTRTGAEWAVAR